MILLDSSFIIALYNSRDERHQDAQKLIKEIANREFGDVFISDYVFDEVATGLARCIGHDEAVRICQLLLDSTYLTKVTEPIFRGSFEMFRKQKSKLSFTDCTNVVIMEDSGIKNIATFDSDFKSINYVNVVQ